ncbi:MAG: DUF4956 domain-containing protein [Firmicutes bacterium HGW-Firmicutes-10]|nr:MAG: DUF4956 domain-containing protein [Firmicutes bacterium HGW-Firmicutes-10]
MIYIYRKTFSGVSFSKSFALLLILVTMVTALVIRTISTNLALSLGMVGALSIVRFRTAIKDPIDTGFVFWGITAGIMSGVGVYLVALISSIALGGLFWLSYLLGFKSSSQYLLILKFDLSVSEKVKAILAKMPKHKLRSKHVSGSFVEMTFDIDVKEGKESITDAFLRVDGIESVSLVSYQNDFGL